MAQSSGFFNAILSEGNYDRKYNAEDYSDNLAVIIGNGVLRSTDNDLKCSASGLVVSVNVGRAWINGHYYNNDATYSFSATTPPVGGNRYDRVVLRLDNRLSGRKITLEYLQGEVAESPEKPAPVRTSDIYDLVLCDIYVIANAESLTITDTREDEDLCGSVYSVSGDGSFFTKLEDDFHTWFAEKKDELSSVTLFKRYTQEQTLIAEETEVSFNIPQYDADTCFLEVYVNGILDTNNTIAGNVITFTEPVLAGSKVKVNAYKSIDGTGIETISGEITQLQNQVAQIIGVNKFCYKCTGTNDNWAISEIVQAINYGEYDPEAVSATAEAFLTAIGGNTYLGNLDDYAQIELDIVGKPGIITPYAGNGTSADNYKWFNLGTYTKKVIVNFSKCEIVNVTCSAMTYNIIFYGNNQNIKNANVKAHTVDGYASCNILMLAGSNNYGDINVDNSRLIVDTSGYAYIARTGNFTNCNTTTKSLAGNSVCFNAKTDGLVRVINGNHYAYGVGQSTVSVLNISAGEANAIVFANNINAPSYNITGYIQKNLAIGNSGNLIINGAVSTLLIDGTTLSIKDLISKSKHIV